ncbi:mechanosensitive ion channel domain-containing protein [Beggiatoa leptomitoformis]|uniref:Mechanosensitive ion channel n=1 Tax=Beggiatoa leptomitoformis TaxID=288004 RepID=A0A2N9YIL8_9GAMM|nr:mechanosensitive ion channel domain-containing protein [Beggiatoa leptomitoformis]ALG67443.1 mechanosensitive ion channel [Beggiatoa leptomitoformis]AUI70340.1 mechanosensitive ion channel [Beggiatoa leptomitoformis]
MLFFKNIFLILSLWIICTLGFAESPPPASTLPPHSIEQLLEERKRAVQLEQEALQVTTQQFNEQESLWATVKVTIETTVITEKYLQEADLAQQEAKLAWEKRNIAIQNLSDTLKKKELEQQTQQTKLDSLNQQVVDTELRVIKNQQISELTDDIQLQAQIIDLIKQQLDIAQKHLEVAEQFSKLMTQRFSVLMDVYNQQSRQQLSVQIEQQQQYYVTKSEELQKQLDTLQDEGKSWQRELLNGQLQDVDEQTQKVARTLRLEQIAVLLNHWSELNQQKSLNINDLSDIETVYTELSNMQTLLKNKHLVIQQQQALLQKRGEALAGKDQQLYQQTLSTLQTIETRLQSEIMALPPLLTQIKQVYEHSETLYKQIVKETLLKRRIIPSTMTGWEKLGNDFADVPIIFWKQLKLTLLNFKHTAESIPENRWSMISIGILAWLLFFIGLRRYLTHLFQQLESMAEHSFAIDTFLTLLRLLNKNAYSIAFSGLFTLFIWIAQPNLTSTLFAFILIFPWLVVKIPLNLAWLLLAEKEVIPPENQRLYRNLRWVIMVTGLFVVITALAHLIDIDSGITAWIDTLFMLFLSLTVIPIMMIRRQTLHFLEEKAALKNHWLFVIRFISLLIPLTIITVSLLGLVGYINLGWYVAASLSVLGLVLTGWLILQGGLEDIIYLWKNYALKYSQNGLLWTQDIIPLFHRLLGIALAISTVTSFFWLNGWLNDVAMEDGIQRLANYTLNIFGITFTLKNLLLAGVTLWFVFWFGGWIRRVTYRWIYVNIIDLGVRNSLSVFTQYVVLIVGLLLGLQVMGIDLTTFAVFAGALGVGVGLGLQNIANNFFSGILLLIERPLRTGDIVNIGDNYEGTVTKLGIRSITIKTWNKQDVIVPNSQLISSAFINWTHSDHLLRITLYIGVSYDDNPHQAKEIILSTLSNIPNILADPAPIVTLWEFSDYFVNFRIDYHINLQTGSSFTTRDLLLFALWDNFKAAGITFPYPQQDIHVKELT